MRERKLTDDKAMSAIDREETERTRRKYDRTARMYNVLEFPMEVLWYGRWRKRLFDRVKSEAFLEVGIGTGKNLRFHPPGAKVVGVDLSESMMKRAAAHLSGHHVTLIHADTQRLPFKANTFESVVATFVFCSVPDPVVGLQEIQRVLKPDGRLILLEHVLPRQAALARLFNMLDRRIAQLTGVHINRRTADNIRRAGFVVVQQSNLLFSVFQMFEAKSVSEGGL